MSSRRTAVFMLLLATAAWGYSFPGGKALQRALASDLPQRSGVYFAALMLAEYDKYGLQSRQNVKGTDMIVLTGSDLILTVTQIFLLLIVTALSVWLQRPQMAASPAAPAKAAPPTPKPSAASARRSSK